MGFFVLIISDDANLLRLVVLLVYNRFPKHIEYKLEDYYFIFQKLF